MRRLLFLLALAACGGGSTEPKLSGTFTLTAVNGVPAEAPFDASSCANVYEGVSFVQLQFGSVNAHFRTHPNCRSGDNVYDDGGSYTVSGQTITLKLNRATVSYQGSISSDQNTINIDMRDVWNPDVATTARFTFVRS